MDCHVAALLAMTWLFFTAFITMTWFKNGLFRHCERSEAIHFLFNYALNKSTVVLRAALTSATSSLFKTAMRKMADSKRP